jgi:uncharacterized protein
MKVVVDTNIFVMAFSSRSPYHDIFLKLRSGVYELVVTSDILLEYEEIMTIKYGLRGAQLFLQFLEELPNVNFVRTFFRFNIISDYDDNKFVDACFATNAKYLVSQDKHFKILSQIEFPAIEVIDADTFLSIVRNLDL